MKKKRISIIIIIAVVLMIVFGVAYRLNSPDKLIDGIDEIKKITITFYPWDMDRKQSYELKTQELLNICEMIENTEDIKTTYFPSEAESVQWDNDFEINIEYPDGKSEQIFSTETNQSVFKYIDTKSDHGRGYMMGKNKELCDYIFSIYQNNFYLNQQ